MKSYLEEQQEQMLKMLEQLVNIDSGSYDKEGVDKIGAVMKQYYQDIDFEVEEVKQAESGNHLIVRKKNVDPSKPTILILTHMDTVFEKGTARERPFSIKGNRAYGPGVIDMKASLVSVYYAINALLENEKESVGQVEILLTSDEEIGSQTSRELIEKHARNKKFALVMEPARKNGAIVSARRGKGLYTLEVIGKAAHSGIEPEKGRSAIEELAYKIIQLYDITDEEEGIHVNVGLIEGGTSVNTVSDHATAQVDVRFRTQEQAEEIKEQIATIMASTEVDGTKVNMKGDINRPPMEKTEQTEKLLRIIKRVGDDLDIFIKDTETGGGSDASFTSVLGIPTVDGLGPVGGRAHRESEYLELDSFIPRTLLLAHVIDELAKS
ncbi:M20/M25/M40 family metallo-hydrolase [Gracilibacillus salitolerans]|uniref:M20/M25/M40 family metallo-hydrolase n=1 Tax=Gracilibacillus salitolerans TaxID=2663022 RepID=A0A5Q2TJ40_9BACI|nr:M20 family metallopeptidase [Gracilibacillus salitolerans]QGH34695.1 M20/M25/M40 family metallo-hydrolase [Gracilibacillus salitolerans]